MIEPVLRIWFNRTYATTVHSMRMLRANPDQRPVHLIASHPDPSSPVLVAADEAFIEPEGLTGAQYVEWALSRCRERSVEVFIPRLELASIAAAREAFTEAGVALVAGPAQAAALLDDKAAAYADAIAAGLPVPPYHVVADGAGLIAAHDDLARFGTVVMKPVVGVGGEGYRVLSTEPMSAAELLGPLTPRVALGEAAAALDAAGRSVLVMPYLPGPEVSVDCLADQDGRLLAAVPRSKIKRVRALIEDPAAVEIAASVVRRHRLSSLSNTQVRYWHQPGVDTTATPYLLETNARAAGGLFQTELAGVNLIWAAVLLALGEEVHLPHPALGARYATVSSLVAYPAQEAMTGGADVPVQGST